MCNIDENFCGVSAFTTSSTTGIYSGWKKSFRIISIIIIIIFLIELTHRVEGVQVHVFYPLLNNDSAVSAQIFWTALPAQVQPSFYDALVRTADEDMTDITVRQREHNN